MPESNRRQALFPRGSRIIPNSDGTAPGIDMNLEIAAGRRCRVFALPGVPAEMRTMWRATVAPALLAMQPEAATIVQRRIKCFGAGESAIEALLPDLVRRGRDPLVGITAHEATITLRIAARGRNESECRATIAPTEATIRECLGPLAYGVEDDEVEDAAVRSVVAAGTTLATVEIGTEGRVAALLAQAQQRQGAAVQGPAGYRGGLVLPPDDSAADVAALAGRARATFNAKVGLAIGPVRPAAEGRSSLDILLATPAGVERIEHMLGGGPALACSRAAKTAIDLVRLRLGAGTPLWAQCGTDA
jgi:nicotinamide-nucleotide amidase